MKHMNNDALIDVHLTGNDLLLISMLVYSRLHDVNRLLDAHDDGSEEYANAEVLRADRDYAARLQKLASTIDRLLVIY